MTLASALCLDPEVRFEFTDGILWIQVRKEHDNVMSLVVMHSLAVSCWLCHHGAVLAVHRWLCAVAAVTGTRKCEKSDG
jgi:hypothetical protein